MRRICGGESTGQALGKESRCPRPVIHQQSPFPRHEPRRDSRAIAARSDVLTRIALPQKGLKTSTAHVQCQGASGIPMATISATPAAGDEPSDKDKISVQEAGEQAQAADGALVDGNGPPVPPAESERRITGASPSMLPKDATSKTLKAEDDVDSEDDFKDAETELDKDDSKVPIPSSPAPPIAQGANHVEKACAPPDVATVDALGIQQDTVPVMDPPTETTLDTSTAKAQPKVVADDTGPGSKDVPEQPEPAVNKDKFKESESKQQSPALGSGPNRNIVSEWSHQRTVSLEPKKDEDDGFGEWQTMPALAAYDMYDDDDKLIAREAHESDDEGDAYAGLGGAGRGYTRVQLDEDAQSATSLDENTQYLFKDINGGTGTGEMDDEEQRDAVSQMQATKDLLTEGQRIAYVGMTRLISSKMLQDVESIPMTKRTKKEVQMSTEALKMWSQTMMLRLYTHMDISAAEQIMIEQLADHGVMPQDLSPTLMQNARVKNPMADDHKDAATTSNSDTSSPVTTTSDKGDGKPAQSPVGKNIGNDDDDDDAAEPPPPYEQNQGQELPSVRTPSQLPTTAKLDIDIRWTILCDLFLTLIADSAYDARSRVLLESVAKSLDISWLDICKFEKRVTDALEMQQEAEKENWNEDEHKENRRKLALKKRYIVMGLATVGGGLVIGLSAGLLAPVIGAGLAAGFSTIGVAGTGTFLAGAGGAAIITSGAVTSGGIIAVRAANRRTGAVKTFEYRPLHNNKRVNLIVTVSGWMTGKVDDVRLPYSTIDPVMGDIYSVLWEPDMLRSTGDTINILATEV